MGYFSAQGLYSSHTTYAHRDGTTGHERSEDGHLIGYHDSCAPAKFRVNGQAHAEYGYSWAPWLVGVNCETCGEPC